MSQNLVAVQGFDVATRAAGTAGAVLDGLGGPMGVIGRVCGLGTDELDAGVPGWAWFGIGALIGGTLVYHFRSNIERVVEG